MKTEEDAITFESVYEEIKENIKDTNELLKIKEAYNFAKENLEQELGRSVISNTNALNYRYLDENLLENKVSDKNE